MDRVAPVSGFDKLAGGEKGRSAIQINITGVPGVDLQTPSDPLEGEYTVDE